MSETKTPQESMRELFQESIDGLIERRDSDWSWIPNLPEMLGVNPESVKWSMTFGQDPYLSIPFDRRLIENVRAKMLELGFGLVWESKENEFDNTYADYRQSWRMGDWQAHKSIVVAFDDSKPGSVCKRRKIGEVAVTKPVYEFSCVEGVEQ